MGKLIQELIEDGFIKGTQWFKTEYTRRLQNSNYKRITLTEKQSRTKRVWDGKRTFSLLTKEEKRLYFNRKRKEYYLKYFKNDTSKNIR